MVEFLSYLYNGGRFGVIATARSALGNFIHVPGDNSFWATGEYHPCILVVSVTTDMVIFNLGTTLLKHSRPANSNPHIVFHRYPHGRRLCPLQIIRDYVTQIDNFFITHSKPYHPASKDTLARWTIMLPIVVALLLPPKRRCLESPWNIF